MAILKGQMSILKVSFQDPFVLILNTQKMGTYGVALCPPELLEEASKRWGEGRFVC
jgi:hypothetical protein